MFKLNFEVHSLVAKRTKTPWLWVPRREHVCHQYRKVTLRKWPPKKEKNIWKEIGIGIEVGMTWGSVKNSGEACVFCTVLTPGAKLPLSLQCKTDKPPQSFWHSLKSFQLHFQFQLFYKCFFPFSIILLNSNPNLTNFTNFVFMIFGCKFVTLYFVFYL